MEEEMRANLIYLRRIGQLTNIFKHLSAYNSEYFQGDVIFDGRVNCL